jgi:hypothetical protein
MGSDPTKLTQESRTLRESSYFTVTVRPGAHPGERSRIRRGAAAVSHPSSQFGILYSIVHDIYQGFEIFAEKGFEEKA